MASSYGTLDEPPRSGGSSRRAAHGAGVEAHADHVELLAADERQPTRASPPPSDHSAWSYDAEGVGERARTAAILFLVCVLVAFPFFAWGTVALFRRLSMDFTPPGGTIVAETQALADTVLKRQVLHNPLLFMVRSRDASQSVLAGETGGELCALTLAIAGFNESAEFIQAGGYCLLSAVGAVAQGRELFVTADNRTSLITADFQTQTTMAIAKQAQDTLLASLNLSGYSHLAVEYTSFTLVWSDVVTDIIRDMARVEMIAIPFAFLALGVCLRSLRMLLIPVIVIIVTLSITFTIGYFLTMTMAVSQFASEATLATSLAFSTDYCLFVLTRFKELAPRLEAEFGDSLDTRYRVCREVQRLVARNVVTSGIVIAVVIGALTPMPLVGSSGALGSLSFIPAILVPLALGPCLLLVFYTFFRKETDFGGPQRWLRSKFGTGGDSEAAPLAPPGGGTSPIPADTGDATGTMREETLRQHQNTSFWFKVGRLANTRPAPVIAAIVIVGAPLFWQASTVRWNDSVYQQVSASSPKANVLQEVNDNFHSPFFVTLDTGRAGSFFRNDTREAVFRAAQRLTGHLEGYINSPGDTRGVFESFAFDGRGVPLSAAAADELRRTDANYAAVFGSTVDPTGRAGVLRLVPAFNAFGQRSASFLDDLNDGIEAYGHRDFYRIGLTGGSSVSWAIMHTVVGYFPYQIGFTMLFILLFIMFVFRSVFVAVRMVLTVGYTLAFGFGFATLFFQYSWTGHVWSAMEGVDSWSWLIPIYGFAMACSLAVDYDIFLMTRVVELLELGYEHHVALQKSVWRTGRTISYAGVIMVVFFGTLVFSEILMLAQFGFFCAVSVLLDTFVIRPLLAPALMSLLPARIAWWPQTFGPLHLGMDDFAGL